MIECAGRIAGLEQRGAQVEPRERVVRGSLDGLPQVRDGFGPLAFPECFGATDFGGRGILQEPADLLHQRIGRRYVDVAAQPHLRVGASRIAEAAVGERQRIVNARRARPQVERSLEMLRGGRVVLGFEVHAAEAVEHGSLARLQRQRFRQGRFGGVSASLHEAHLAEPHEAGDVIGLQRQRAFEQRGRSGRIVRHPRDVAEVVGPAHLVRLEQLRVAEATSGLIQELGGHEQPAHLAVRGGQRRRWSSGLANLLLQRRVLIAQLRLDGRRGLRDVRQLDRSDRGVFFRLRGRLLRCAATPEHEDEREQGGRQYARHAWIPLPSTMVM